MQGRYSPKPPRTVACGVCGEDFVTQTRARWCSLECRKVGIQANYTAKQRASGVLPRGERYPQAVPDPRPCKHCEAPFVGNKDQSFCTLICQYAWRSAEAASKRSCSECGQTTDSRRSLCNQCADVRLARRDLLRALRSIARDKRRPLDETRACGHCGKAYTTKVASQRVCSTACGKRHSGWNAKARGKQAAPDEGQTVYRYEIIERDRGICQLCGGAVRFDVSPHHARAPSMDHTAPLARGGVHEPSNVQLAHLRCNSVKSDGMHAAMASRRLRKAGFGGHTLYEQVSSVLQALDQAGWYADELDLRDLCLTSIDPTQGANR